MSRLINKLLPNRPIKPEVALSFRSTQELENNTLQKRSQNFLETGGLAQVSSLRGGSRTRFAFSCLSSCFATAQVTPPSPSFNCLNPTPLHGEGYYFWVADEGYLYPRALHCAYQFPLSRLLIAKVEASHEAWEVGLEAIQTGLFSWIFLRPSLPCHPHFLRKVQLAAERSQSRVFLLSKKRLPHWLVRMSFEASGQSHETTHSLFSKSGVPEGIQRSLSVAYPESIRL